ncbi:TetR/AcrR family transcriptional regulator [Ruminococcus flavefaciens]|uniref:TetR/AcrR family transcriptional regulator n=1 Tax=Ruminococcus flavefaciens TaxID=1265 RepID=UPI0026EDC3A1|nr:TetR/AcrR family transcriptional regulator [Ruminococcus flavefaciens]
MANRIEGVTEKLLEQAMKEFLDKGYTAASLRTIAENAGTTPRSVYTRYGDKEGLFAALVSESADKLKSMFTSYMDSYDTRPVDEQKNLFHDDKFDAEY